MKEKGDGRFVFITSSAGMFGQPNSAHYAAAKAGIVGLANVIAIEGAPHGIRVNSVAPFGYSRMVTETAGEREELEREPGFLHAIESDLVVPLVVYLASRGCELTHQTLSACAGRYARIFVGLAEGWLAEPGTKPTAEDVSTNLSEIIGTEPHLVPDSIFDEITDVCRQLGL
jgi:NAD(P)-dependent dehydrogenase (short-subunit alcohol dehydrogenase family)